MIRGCVGLVADFGGRYRRGRLLGAGGMGKVWLAYDEDLDDRPVAIKVMRSTLLTDPEDAARFQREMRLAARMQHPNIMTVYTTGTDNGVPFMVLEYLEGRDLSKAVADSAGRTPAVLDSEVVARIGRDTCAALAYAHGLGVVHRDIKPGNLFLCDSGLVKVSDFGIAKAISGSRLSATGTLLGTLPYIAPEQWLGEPAAFSNDIWAVGCVLYELLSGALPRACAAPADYVTAAARGERVAPLASSRGIPPWLANVIMAMLQPDPRSRPTAADCGTLLAGPAAGSPWASAIRPGGGHAASGGAASRADTLPAAYASGGADTAPPPRRSPRRRAALVTAAIALLAAAGGTAAALAQRPASGAASGIGPGTGQRATSSRSAPPSSRPAASPGSPQSASASSAGGNPSLPASSVSATAPTSSGTWIAQLGSVPVSAGTAALQSELSQIRVQVPGAQYLASDSYASLRPGYWVIYYDGSFSNGTQALAYCAAHGLTTTNQCVGRLLSTNPADIGYICRPPGGPQETSCYRP